MACHEIAVRYTATYADDGRCDEKSRVFYICDIFYGDREKKDSVGKVGARSNTTQMQKNNHAGVSAPNVKAVADRHVNVCI